MSQRGGCTASLSAQRFHVTFDWQRHAQEISLTGIASRGGPASRRIPPASQGRCRATAPWAGYRARLGQAPSRRTGRTSNKRSNERRRYSRVRGSRTVGDDRVASVQEDRLILPAATAARTTGLPIDSLPVDCGASVMNPIRSVCKKRTRYSVHGDVDCRAGCIAGYVVHPRTAVSNLIVQGASQD